MTTAAALVSVNVGMPKDVDWHGKTVHTGIWKDPVAGPRMVRRLNIDGDGQGDLAGHGGEQRAILVYQVESMEYWRDYLGRDGIAHGQFGENFTVAGLGDDEVCIGDRYRIGEAEFEVTQPRVTCFRLGMRLGAPRLPSLLVAHHRPGFYLRVISEGRVQAGDAIVRTRRGPHEMSVATIDALLYLPGRDPDQLRAALDIPALSPGWHQSFEDLLRAAQDGARTGAAAAPKPGVEPGWTGFRTLRVARIVPESTTITSVYLEAEDGAALPEPAPGQYLTLRMPGAGDPAPVRSYSLSSAPADAAYRISVKREGLASTYIQSGLRAGAEVQAAAPRGDFVLEPGDEPVLLLSAGVGVTPVLAMLHRLAAERSEREVWWLHTARNAAQQAFADEAHRLADSLPNVHEHVFLTAPDSGADADAGAGTDAQAGAVAGAGAARQASGPWVTSGRLSVAALAGLGIPANATAYVCGPQGFMTAMRDALTGLGLEPARIRTELFGARAPINPGVTSVSVKAPHQPPGPPGTGARITFARSGITVRWSEGPGSLLELAEACDVPTRWACRTGVCHTCVTGVLAGAVAYRPDPLEPPAEGEALVCCSRPDGDLVLDM
jgi:ferredoxin-NADP reductase/MOSC domain-containing protein YiiM